MKTAVAASRSPTGTALLVDGDDETRQLYADHLKRSAWAVEEATDGRDALAKALARRHDVVVTDTHLSGISGYDLCVILKRDVATRAVPVVMITGYDLPADLQRAVTAGADRVLLKPCMPATLHTEMQRLLATAQALRSRSSAPRESEHQQLATDPIPNGSHHHLRAPLSHSYDRHDTTTPPLEPPVLLCPQCTQPLTYQRSHVGGVSERHAEQWDYFQCTGGCGAFQYRPRTRKLRKVT
jgi:CheY-like chemotaxis protein